MNYRKKKIIWENGRTAAALNALLYCCGALRSLGMYRYVNNSSIDFPLWFSGTSVSVEMGAMGEPLVSESFRVSFS